MMQLSQNATPHQPPPQHYVVVSHKSNPLFSRVVRLDSRCCSGVRVKSGKMWVTCAGKDYALRGGETLWFNTKGDQEIIISNQGFADLVFEVLQ